MFEDDENDTIETIDANDAFNQTMERLRALLSSSGTMDEWRELCIILRRPRGEEDQALLLDYVTGHILGWAPALSVALHEWWRENPAQPPHVRQLLERIADWQWSPGVPGEVRGIPGLRGAHVVWVPAGSYEMGNHHAPAAHEGPLTRVTITRPLWVWQTPVTQSQYTALCSHNPSYFSGAAAHPVERVTWHEAMAFCHALNDLLALPSSIALDGQQLNTRAIVAGPYHVNNRYLRSEGFRLPSEAEWEYACRANEAQARYDLASGDPNELVELEKRAWFSANARGRTHPVYQTEPNAWNLHDMLGHVAEWCVDLWHPSLPGGEETDPVRLGPKSPQDGTSRALRGSSWYHKAESLHPAFRDRHHAEESLAFFGFRPVKAG